MEMMKMIEIVDEPSNLFEIIAMHKDEVAEFPLGLDFFSDKSFEYTAFVYDGTAKEYLGNQYWVGVPYYKIKGYGDTKEEAFLDYYEQLNEDAEKLLACACAKNETLKGSFRSIVRRMRSQFRESVKIIQINDGLIYGVRNNCSLVMPFLITSEKCYKETQWVYSAQQGLAILDHKDVLVGQINE